MKHKPAHGGAILGASSCSRGSIGDSMQVQNDGVPLVDMTMLSSQERSGFLGAQVMPAACTSGSKVWKLDQ